MAQAEQPATMQATQPREIPRSNKHLRATLPVTTALSPPSSSTIPRNSFLNLDTFSPVNQNGSFEFDRVLKSGYLNKRTRRTKGWKSIYLVLRPNYLSIYKDQNEAQLRHKILLADLTAVASLKDPKQRRQNVFGLFSPSRNYHLEANSAKESREWVDCIRKEARIEEEEEELYLASPGGHITSGNVGFERAVKLHNEQRLLHNERVGSSSPEPLDPPSRPTKASGSTNQRRPSYTYEYSGNELASHSDMSDFEGARARGSSNVSVPEEPLAVKTPPNPNIRPIINARNHSQLSGFNTESDPERVVWQGYLLYLKSKGGVRQWKDLWVVVRLRNVAIYKNEEEYSPRFILPITSIINAVEIDPVSKTKRNCLELITEEKRYKFCAHSEEGLDKSLGAIKSVLSKRKEQEGKGAREP